MNLYQILLAYGCGNLTNLIFYELYRVKPIKEYIQRVQEKKLPNPLKKDHHN